jgi:glycosyltransferase involved in cell wall biosynthesis
VSRGKPTSVSVAIWTCDQEAFIGEAIESALDQDYPEVEVVVADDCSGDSTPALINEYARRHPGRVRPLLHRGPRSIVDNVNRALAACRGELVAILDGDDAFLPGKISAQVEAFAVRPEVAICRHPVQEVDERGMVIGEENYSPELRVAGARELLTLGLFIEPASCMMRRSAIPSAGVPTLARNAPDYLLAIETARHGSILRIDEVLGRYRRHPGQITAPTPGSEVVFEDAMRAIAYVEAKYPELADACPRARANMASWEAHRRLDSAHLDWVSKGLRRALRLAPLDHRLWRAYAGIFARRLRGRL